MSLTTAYLGVRSVLDRNVALLAMEACRGSLPRAPRVRRHPIREPGHLPEDPRILVVLPTYDERENLPRIVPLILAEDPRIEVLVVDDNSPDGTGEIADAYAARDARVQVLHRARKQAFGGAARAAALSDGEACRDELIDHLTRGVGDGPQSLVPGG